MFGWGLALRTESTPLMHPNDSDEMLVNFKLVLEFRTAKGNLVNIPKRRIFVGDCAATQRDCDTAEWELRRVLFSF
jgi:hypothetical protein